MKLNPRKWGARIAALALCAVCAGQASALEYTVDAPEDYLFGRPSSVEIVYRETAPVNTDRSKNVSLIPPGFGTPTSYLPGSGGCQATFFRVKYPGASGRLSIRAYSPSVWSGSYCVPKPPTSEEQSENISSVLVSAPITKYGDASIFTRLVQPLNIKCIFVTFEVSKFEISNTVNP